MKTITFDSNNLKLNKAHLFLIKTMKLWFLIATLGLILFAYYMIHYYLGSAISGNMEAWAESSIKGFQSGDILGNIIFGMHILLGVIITFGGVIQLIPYLRRRHIKLHKLNGMLFISTAILISLGGLYLIWIRDSTTTLTGAIATSLNALLLMYTAIKTWLSTKSNDKSSHRKWALRVFVLANGVWFFRVGFMAWIIINQGQKWSTDNLDGPFDYFISFASYLIPLLILESYFKASESNNPRSKYIFASMMILFSLITLIGIVAAYFFMWKPLIVSI